MWKSFRLHCTLWVLPQGNYCNQCLLRLTAIKRVVLGSFDTAHDGLNQVFGRIRKWRIFFQFLSLCLEIVKIHEDIKSQSLLFYRKVVQISK